mgnify:CR=1 FL=1
MPERRIWYYPSQSHKKATTEAGPPRWQPRKEACPEDMTLKERDALVMASIPRSEDPLDPVRYAIRRHKGELQWFVTKFTQEHPDGRIEVHGYPFVPGDPKVPPRVARQLKTSEIITDAEYKRIVKA